MGALIPYLGSLFLGWSLGSNDSANVFGTAVSSRMVSYRLAVVLTAVFVVVGAVVQGSSGIRTLSEDLRERPAAHAETAGRPAATEGSAEGLKVAMLVSLAAAFTVSLMTSRQLPVSTSQAVVGAIVGMGCMQHNVRLAGLGKVVICWVGTPIGAACFAVLFYHLFRLPLRLWRPSVFAYDPTMTLLLIGCGCYGAYALGANNVANVSAMFVSEGLLTIRQAAVFGGLSIAFGAVTYSRRVMMTVGQGLVRLDAFAAFVCVLAHAVTVHLYAVVGVPVSTSQAIVGAVMGIGAVKGVQTVRLRAVGRVVLAWILTPLIAGLAAALAYVATNLHYAP